MKHKNTETGDRLLLALQALSSPHRMRIVAALHVGGRNYVSRLAREVGLSRPLLHLHLQKLEDAGLVASRLELSSDGKALNFYELKDFEITVSAAIIAQMAPGLTARAKTTD